VGGVALLFGLVFIMSFSVLYAVLHSSKGKAGPPK
jgi:hypothetical protein